MMIIRLLMAAFSISLGLTCIFAPGAVWVYVEQFNRALGKSVTRTKAWDARVALAGVVMIGSGVVFLVIAYLQS